MRRLYCFQQIFVNNFAFLWRFYKINVMYAASRMVLRHVQCVTIPETQLDKRARHLFKPERNKFLANFVKKSQVSLFLPWPQPWHRSFYIISSEVGRFPRTASYYI